MNDAAPLRIISGGQTGVDRAALDAARALGLERGGWCPRGRRAEDGRIPSSYPLVELASRGYPRRTERNIREADATLILTSGPPAGGTALTLTLARRLGKPHRVVDLDAGEPAERITAWLGEIAPVTLNVAGPRESAAPGIHERARKLLLEVLEGTARPAASAARAVKER